MAFPDSAGTAETYSAVRAAAADQGFRGTVAVVWEDAMGRARFIAEPQQHPFFQVMNYCQLRAQVNGTLAINKG